MRFAKAFLLSLGVAAVTPSSALVFEDICAAVEGHPSLDTVNMHVSLTAQAGGALSTMQMHLITKGKEKTWMELRSQILNQRIIKNGKKYQVTDLVTGQKATPDLPPAMLGQVPDQAMGANLLRAGQYRKPVQVGPTSWRLELVPGTDPTVNERTLVYDSGVTQIVEIVEVDPKGDMSVTKLDFSGASGFGVPARMSIEVKGKDAGALISIVFSKVVKPKSISDALFQIN
jgi:hypothetical protein